MNNLIVVSVGIKKARNMPQNNQFCVKYERLDVNGMNVFSRILCSGRSCDGAAEFTRSHLQLLKCRSQSE